MNTYVVNRYNKPTPGATAQSIQIPNDSTDTFQFTAFDPETRVVYISVFGGGISFTIDGSAVNNQLSHRLYAGNSYYFNSDAIAVAKFMKTAGNTATAKMYLSEMTH
jgi:hypothetical protein